MVRKFSRVVRGFSLVQGRALAHHGQRTKKPRLRRRGCLLYYASVFPENGKGLVFGVGQTVAQLFHAIVCRLDGCVLAANDAA